MVAARGTAARGARHAPAFGVVHRRRSASTWPPAWRAGGRHRAAAWRRRASAQGAQGRDRRPAAAAWSRPARCVVRPRARAAAGDVERRRRDLWRRVPSRRMLPVFDFDDPAVDHQRRACSRIDQPARAPGRRRRRRDRLRVRLDLRRASAAGDGHRDARPAPARRGSPGGRRCTRRSSKAGVESSEVRCRGLELSRPARVGLALAGGARSRRRSCWSASAARRSAAAWALRRPGRSRRARLRGHRRHAAHVARRRLRRGRRGRPAAARPLGLPAGRDGGRERRHRVGRRMSTAASCRTASSATPRWRASALSEDQAEGRKPAHHDRAGTFQR